eukprot:scaffold67692_cov36-Cyclotella_meneghiniana.AAC.3
MYSPSIWLHSSAEIADLARRLQKPIYGVSTEAQLLREQDLKNKPEIGQNSLGPGDAGVEEGRLLEIVNVNPEAILFSGFRYPAFEESVYIHQSEEVKQQLSLLDVFLRKHKYKQEEGASNDKISYAEDMPRFYYQYYMIVCDMLSTKKSQESKGKDNSGNDPDDGGDEDPSGDDSGEEESDDEDDDEGNKFVKTKKGRTFKKPHILEGIDAVLVKTPDLWFELGAEVAIRCCYTKYRIDFIKTTTEEFIQIFRQSFLHATNPDVAEVVHAIKINCTIDLFHQNLPNLLFLCGPKFETDTLSCRRTVLIIAECFGQVHDDAAVPVQYCHAERRFLDFPIVLREKVLHVLRGEGPANGRGGPRLTRRTYRQMPRGVGEWLAEGGGVDSGDSTLPAMLSLSRAELYLPRDIIQL